MRIVLVLSFLLAIGACGKKKAPQSPASTDPAAEPASTEDMKNGAAPDDADDAAPMGSADPEEGGE